MLELFMKFISGIGLDFLQQLQESHSVTDIFMSAFPETAFRAETVIGEVLDTALVENLYNSILLFGISLIVLKFLKKGFETYILWTDGDPDADPVALLTNFFKAIAMSVSFFTLYDWIVDAAMELITLLENTINVVGSTDILMILESRLTVSGNITNVIFVLMLLIFLVLLYFQFMKRGIEMVVLRVGMPIACLGLLDSDKGVFKPFMQKFFQNALTVLVQIILGKIGLAVSLSGHYFWAFAILSVALSTPKFLQEFMIASGGGGMGNIYHFTSLARSAAAPIKKLFTK